MDKPLKDLVAQLERLPSPKSEPKIIKACRFIGVVGLYAGWGLFSSILLWNVSWIRPHGLIARGLVGLVLAGLMPTVWHVYEGLRGKTEISLGSVLACLYAGGLVALFLGSGLQWLLVLCGIRMIFGAHIDEWYWKLPSQMFEGD